MEEDVKSLSDYISIAWRRKFHIIIPFVVLLLVTVATVMVLPPVYKSTGTILIESQQIPEELIQSTVTTFADERIQVIRQRIMTSQQLFGIIRKFNLYADEIQSTPRSEILNDMRNRISIDRVSANVRGRGRGSSALIAFTVSFEHKSPGVAQRVANELVTLFLDENIRSRTARAEETSDFLKQEGDRLRAEIEGVEEQIASFKQEHEGSLPEALRLNLDRVLALKTSMMGTDNELFKLNESRKFLVIDLESLQDASGETAGLSEEQRRRKEELTALQNRYISLSARYGADHPDVKSIKRQVAAFEEEFGILGDVNDLREQEQEVRDEIRELTRKYSSEHPDVKKLNRKLEGIEEMILESESETVADKENSRNPAMLQIEAKIETIDNSIDRIEKTRTDLQRQIDELEAHISKTPQVERGLEALERDYANIRQKYEEIKAKQLQAELSKSLEEEQKGERFTLLEPPQRPDTPVKPNRPKLLALGLMLSFAGGIGVAGVAESFDGGIRGTRALAMATKMTPLVTIPKISTARDIAIRKRNIKIMIAVILVLGIGSAAAIHFLYKPLDLLWFILLRKLNLT